MPDIAKLKITNLTLKDIDTFNVNEYFELKKNDNSSIFLIAKIPDEPTPESSVLLLRQALYLTFPDVLISTECIECPDVYINIFKETNVLFSYYTDISEYSEKSSKVLTQSVLHHLTEWHRKVINFTKGSNKQLLWRAAFNEYLESIHCGAVELAFLHLITAIEALLLEDSSELKYRLSLYAAVLLGHNYETRNKIFNTLKKSYDIRSKVVHGDIKGIQNKIKSEEIYNSMFELRSVTSELLSITYGKDKKDVINKIQESLLKCPDITL